MTVVESELLDEIDGIYATVFDATKWPSVMDAAATAAGAFGCILVVDDPFVRELEITVCSQRIAGHDAETYIRKILAGDERRWHEALDNVPAFTLLDDKAVWPDRAAYAAMPSTQWLSSWHVGRRSAVRLCAHGGWKDSLAMLYPDDRGGMTPDEGRRLSLRLPHIARAVELRRPFALLKSRYQAIVSVLDRLGIGVLLLVGDDHIFLANAEGERILDAAEGLRRRADGRLGVSQTSADPTRALERALEDVRLGRSPEGTTVYLPRGIAREPYVVDVAAIPENDAEIGERSRATLICVIDPERSDMVSTRGLAKVYGLTAAESAVCRLMGSGFSNREISEIRGVNIETVKAQTKAIYRKTLCANRVELVKRALSIEPPLLGNNGRRED